MPGVTRKHNAEKFETLFRRWKRAVENDGTLQELKTREFYEKPSVRRKRAKAAAKKRAQRVLEQERFEFLSRNRPFMKKKNDQKFKPRTDRE